MPWLAKAADFYVRKNGNDGDPGSSAQPWLTLNKAVSTIASGDTVFIGHGEFDEYVQVTIGNTRWIAETNLTVTNRAFRFDAPTNWLQGVKMTKACDAGWRTWNAFCRLDSDAHWTTITNCHILDQPWVAVTNWSFNPSSPTNTISSISVDLIAKGFVTGGVFWVNGVSYSNTTRGSEFRFANQQRAVRPTNVTTTTMTFSNAVLVAETNPSVWAVISAGATFDFKGISFTPSGGTGPTNCLITGCLFSNMVGQPLLLNGHNNVITNCEFTAIYGNSIMVHGGSNHRFISNYVHHCPLPAYYSELEIVDHTGGNFYDYYVRTIIGSSLLTDNTNFLFQGNWFEEIDGAGLAIQHVVPGDESDYHTYNVIGNVFIGVAGPSDGGQNIMRFQSNTFYRCSFQSAYSESPVTIGGVSGESTNSTLYFTENLMVVNGDHRQHTSEGYQSITLTTGIVNSNNFVCGPEVARWNPMDGFPSTNGINGGDPMFANEFMPRGPDGIPFTEDDGLRLHPRSPALGIGALPVFTAKPTNSLVFFRPTNVASNFLDATGTNFNLPWHTNLYAFTRTAWDREYDIGDALLNLPMTVTFTATNCISGTWTTNDWIGCKDFVWSFGDGSRPVWTRWPDISHTFLRTGAVTITLTITNSATNVFVHTRNYRIMTNNPALFTNEVFYVSTNGNDSNSGLTEALSKLHITNGMARLGPGDYLAVLSGTNEWCDVDPSSTGGPITNGTAILPITVVSYGASIAGGRQEVSWWTWEGFEISGTNVVTTGSDAYFYIRDGSTHGVTLRNCYWNGAFLTTNINAIKHAASGGVGGTNHSIINCHIDRIRGFQGIVLYSGATNVLYDACIDTYSSGEADAFKLYGGESTWSRHTSLAFGFTNNNHSDWMSFGIDSTQPTGNILVERAWVESHFGTATAIANNGNGDVWMQCTNLIVRNSVFINFMNGFNPLGFNSSKIYNNLFYIAPWTNISTIVHGINKSSLNNDFQNNIFFENYNHGVDNSRGWYGNQYLAAGGADTNVIGLIANYNFVCGTNFSAKDAAPPDNAFNWAVTGTEASGINGGNPGFTNAAAYDFRLMSSSPLINAGVVLSGFTTDFWGRERGSTWDIGPFESESEAAVVGTNRITTRLR